MKKYLMIIYVIMFIFILTSCGVKKNIDPIGVKGTKLTHSEISDIQDEYESYKENLENKDFLKYEQWQKINMNSIVKQFNDETEIEIYISVSGKMFSCYYGYKDKMSLTLKLKGTVNEKESNTKTKFNGTIDIIYFETVAYYDINIKTTHKNEYGKTSSRQKELIYGSIDDLESVIGTSIPQATHDYIVSSFIVKMGTQNANIYQKNDNKYYYQKEVNGDNNSSLNEIMIKLNNNYEMKKYKYYESDTTIINGTTYETVNYVSLKKCLPTFINKPRNAKKYLYGDFEFDFGDM